jgi:hypothetical protein
LGAHFERLLRENSRQGQNFFFAHGSALAERDPFERIEVSANPINRLMA